MVKLTSGLSCLSEYETPKVVVVRHIPLSIFRLIVQICVFAFIIVYKLWYMKGYQTFASVESSVTTKVNKTIKINTLYQY